MMRFMKAGLVIGTVGLFSSCMKSSDVQDAPPPETNVPTGALARLEWDNGLTGYFDYNTDNSLKTIQYNLGGSTGKTMFEWSGSRMTSISDDRSLYKNVYTYGPDNKLVKVENVQKSGGASVFLLEYTYNAQGLVDSMKYFATNNGTKVLKTRSGYTYGAGSRLTEVVTESGNNLVKSVVDTWSPELSFIPQMYVDVTLSENYDVYNLPVLEQQDMLPTKITRMVKTGSGNYTTDKVQEIQFTLSGTRVTNTRTTVTFPNVPGSSNVLNAVYIYK
ncbi:MAG: hypothetical protein EOO05_00385 [Chitinophagaceae bacterium]|nr:MAG: hypothetical protein EOO05_00385 [Chitinophagaceae bacterium]